MNLLKIMHWDDPIFIGTRNQWLWVVARTNIPNLPSLVVQSHIHHRLCIRAFDGGRIVPSAEEERLGWTRDNDVMVSPPLVPELVLPTAGYDEWYVFRTIPTPFSVTERFVNFEGMNLADPLALAASQDPTWDAKNYEWLIPIQLKFWSELNRINPISYVSSGESDIVVSQDPAFLEAVTHAVRHKL